MSEQGANKSKISPFSIAKKTIIEFFQEPSFFHGAALAYYAIFALIPMLYLAISSFGAFLGKEKMLVIIDSILQKNVGLRDTSGILSFLNEINIHKGNVLMSIVGVIALLLSSSALLNTVRLSVNEFYDIKVEIKSQRKRIQYNIGTKLISILFLPIFGVIFLLAYFGQTILITLLHSLFGDLSTIEQIVLKIVVFCFTILTNAVLFTLILKYVNDGIVKWKSALYGSLITALLLYVGQLLINYYLSHFFFGSKAGVAGTLLVLMAWIYYTSQIIFIGAKFTKIYSQAIGEPIKFESRRKVFKKRKSKQNIEK